MDLKDSVPAVSQPANRHPSESLSIPWTNGGEEAGRTLEFDHLPFLRYCDQFRPEFDSELRPTATNEKREPDVVRQRGKSNTDRRIRIGQEALVGKADKQRRLAHRGIACKTITSPVSPLKRPICTDYANLPVMMNLRT